MRKIDLKERRKQIILLRGGSFSQFTSPIEQNISNSLLTGWLVKTLARGSVSVTLRFILPGLSREDSVLLLIYARQTHNELLSRGTFSNVYIGRPEIDHVLWPQLCLETSQLMISFICCISCCICYVSNCSHLHQRFQDGKTRNLPKPMPHSLFLWKKEASLFVTWQNT